MKAPRHRLPLLSALAVALASFALACGGSARTTAATQPSPAAFNPAGSDPKAITVADDMLKAVGGRAAWDQVKQIQWEQRYLRDGKLTALFRHAWDRWNGRHRFELVNMASMERAEREGRPDEVEVSVAMYDLFDHQGKGTATVNGQRTDTGTRDQIVDNAFKAFQSDAYRISAIYKVKDPGVKLAHKGLVEPIKEFCKPTCDVIEVTFDPSVGKDTWFISVNSQSKQPELLQKQMPDGKLGFSLSGWTQVGGLKFPTKFENLGAAEVFEIKDIKVGEPQDELYIPSITD
jgi:hypothetical protein